MGLSDILTIVFGLIATALGIMLKAEYDKRMLLQQQVAENKRKAYSKLNELWNDLLKVSKERNSDQKIHAYAKQMLEARQEIWQYGSDEVVKAFSLWSQCSFIGGEDHKHGAVVLMADMIVKMRQDLGLSKKESLTALDILRIFLTDIEEKYDDYVKEAKDFRKRLLSTKHIKL